MFWKLVGTCRQWVVKWSPSFWTPATSPLCGMRNLQRHLRDLWTSVPSFLLKASWNTWGITSSHRKKSLWLMHLISDVTQKHLTLKRLLSKQLWWTKSSFPALSFPNSKRESSFFRPKRRFFCDRHTIIGWNCRRQIATRQTTLSKNPWKQVWTLGTDFLILSLIFKKMLSLAPWKANGW